MSEWSKAILEEGSTLAGPRAVRPPPVSVNSFIGIHAHSFVYICFVAVFKLQWQN